MGSVFKESIGCWAATSSSISSTGSSTIDVKSSNGENLFGLGFEPWTPGRTGSFMDGRPGLRPFRRFCCPNLMLSISSSLNKWTKTYFLPNSCDVINVQSKALYIALGEKLFLSAKAFPFILLFFLAGVPSFKKCQVTFFRIIFVLNVFLVTEQKKAATLNMNNFCPNWFVISRLFRHQRFNPT